MLVTDDKLFHFIVWLWYWLRLCTLDSYHNHNNNNQKTPGVWYPERAGLYSSFNSPLKMHYIGDGVGVCRRRSTDFICAPFWTQNKGETEEAATAAVGSDKTDTKMCCHRRYFRRLQLHPSESSHFGVCFFVDFISCLRRTVAHETHTPAHCALLYTHRRRHTFMVSFLRRLCFYALNSR